MSASLYVTQPCLPLVIQGRVERWAPIGCVRRMSDVLNQPFAWQYKPVMLVQSLTSLEDCEGVRDMLIPQPMDVRSNP